MTSGIPKNGLPNKGWFKRGHKPVDNTGRFKKGNPGYWLGKKRSIEDRKKIGAGHIGVCAGDKHPNWKGGITNFRVRLYVSYKYTNWRRTIFKRDCYTCQECN